MLSRARQDPLLGSAVPARGWFLVEHRGPWAPATLATPPLDRIATELTRVLGPRGVRPQLVRRHRSPPYEDGPRVVGYVDSTRSAASWGTWSTPEDLLDAARWVLSAPEAGSCTTPVVLVCTHGRKDVCCAVEGRPVAAVLEDHWGSAVWETTHLGGDRFAANVAVLPEGDMYGRLDVSNAPGVFGDHLAGRVRLDHWRGRSTWPPAVQAAVGRLLADRPGLGLADVAVAGSHAGGRGAWRVDLLAAGDPASFDVTRTTRPPARMTCGGLEPKPSAEFTAVPRPAPDGGGADPVRAARCDT